MNRYVRDSLLLFLLPGMAPSAVAGASAWSGYRYAPDARMEVDLASDAEVFLADLDSERVYHRGGNANPRQPCGPEWSLC